MKVALATCARLPEPDPDAPLLLAALGRCGLAASLVAWDDGSRTDADLVVLRSTWNYHLDRDRFLAWIDETAARARVLNPPDIVRWNSHKRYLRDLAALGIDVVPTAFVDRGTTMPITEVTARLAAERFVVKPAVSAASFRTRRFHLHDVTEAQGHLDALAAERDVMIQPYVPEVETHGERAHVWIDGEVTHAVRKTPRFGADVEHVSAALDVEPQARSLVAKVLEPWADELLYARVDLVRDARGRLLVMELELIEPSLYLAQKSEALERLADAIATRVRSAG